MTSTSANGPKLSGRALAQARRRALSTGGKTGLQADPRASRPARAPVAPVATVASPAAPTPAPVASKPRSSTVVQGGSKSVARARRAALAKAGRPAMGTADRVRGATDTRRGPAATSAPKQGDCGCGCGGRNKGLEAAPQSSTDTHSGLGSGAAARDSRHNGRRRVVATKPTGRAIALARRSALSGRGKAASNAARPSTATLARQANPKLTSREVAQQVRAARSRNGGSGQGRRAPTGRVRPNRDGAQERGAQDASWKVGASSTASGEVVTGTQVGRTLSTTGNEPGTCGSITGTEYLGAEIFQEFCMTEPTPGPAKVSTTSTANGRSVTGTRTGRSTRVTGDEAGTCKSVTGTEYLSVEDHEGFCGVTPQPTPSRVGLGQTEAGRPVSGVQVGRSARVTGDEPGSGRQLTGTQYMTPVDQTESAAPPKVGLSTTLSGAGVTGTRVGRSAHVTGDEPGSCRLVTGDEYADRGQYKSFCGVEPQPEAAKVGHSETFRRKPVSGTQTGRSARVTGDEPGSCKTVTGTPYAGLDQFQAFCTPEQTRNTAVRQPAMGAPSLTGLQPGLNDGITGAERGACSGVTGTPYSGKEQIAAACDTAAAPGDPDFPRPLEGAGDASASWQHFSVLSPARQAQQAQELASSVTGTRYEQGQITGPFDMGTGKVTGTEQFRFDRTPTGNLLVANASNDAAAVESDSDAEASSKNAVRSRVTGEGQSAGRKVTGDDWERGDRVTGTEGSSATRRNPTRPGPMSAMRPVEAKRNEELDKPTSLVTGSSGSTEKGALVTYSGGARG